MVARDWSRGPEHRAPAAKLAELIAAQAARTPDAAAIRQWDARLTYRELLGTAADLARRLAALGVGPEVRVGVCAGRTPQLPIAALGIMLAGGAYVPLDPAHPRRRLDGILDDAAIPVVVADDPGRAHLAGCGRSLVDVGSTSPATPSPSPTTVPGTSGNAAYVLYTSGSTGRPKGVVVSHHGVTSFVTAAADWFGLDGSCRSLAFSALGFDVSVLDLFAPLTRGASVQLVGDEDRIDPARLQRFLEAHEVTWGFLPPALLPLLDPGRVPHLRDLVVAGEPLPPEQVERWAAPPRMRLHNWYGPTEATVCVVGTELAGSWDRPVPIGRPLPGCRAHVLDEALRPCPPGVPGELYLGGPQVARGYLGRPGLTAERFVPDPDGPEPGARLYRTGDQVMWSTDGRIEFVGRLDRQVKVQGQRVELGEVEVAVRSHPGVLQAVVDADGQPPELVAYLTPSTAPELAELRDHCADRLPAYMLPTRVVRMGVLPLNASGKVDLVALRASGPVATTAAGSPTTPAEASTGDPIAGRVAALWSEILESDAPSPDDDFFAGGGHSLRAMRLVAALRDELGRDVAVEDVFGGRTLQGLVERVVAAGSAAESVPSGTAPALSPAQYRVWFVEQLAPHATAHNIAMAERIDGPLDVDALRAALGVVVARHEVLRWRVPHRDGVPYVAVDEPTEVPLPVDHLSGLDPAARDRALGELLDREARAPFDLATGPLLRARLVRLGDRSHVMVVTVHHLVFDGWSQEVLYRDLAHAYRLLRTDPAASADRMFEPLPVGFADYVGWLRDRAARYGADHLAWWKEHLADAPTVVDLPRDAERQPVQTFGGASCHAATGPELGAAITDLARAASATPYAVLLAAFGQLVRRLTGQHDLVVGTPYADRRRRAFEPLVGFCLQIVPLRLRIDDDADFAEHVRRSQQEVAAAIDHCDAPLERIVEGSNVARDLSRGPLVQVLFNMYNFAEPHLRLDGCAARPVEAGLPGSLFDLTLYVSPNPDGFVFKVVYNPDLYSAERMDALLDSYVALLAALVATPRRPVREASLRPPGSRLPSWDTPLPTWNGPGVVELVERAGRRHPERVAVTGAGGTLTYRQLDELRLRTAVAVRDVGLEPGQTIAVLAARHMALPAVLLGILTAGQRWAVLDPAHPPALLARHATAARAGAVLRCPGAAAVPLPIPAPVLEVSTEGDGRRTDPVGSEAGEASYLAFTSGTTGDPRVVVTSERPLAHFLHQYATTFDLGPQDRFALLSGLAHDPALRDLFTPLAVGACLCVPEQGWLRDPQRLAAWLADEQVSVAHVTPQLARLLDQGAGRQLPALRLVLVGGDQAVDADVPVLSRLAPQARLVNAYGTTETPQVHAWHELDGTRDGDSQHPVPVGSGIDGSVLVVVDPAGRPAGIGELGEIVVRSRWLADGYLDPAFTAARFASTPGAGASDDRIYRTGDLGRYRPDGTVEIVGRVDDQVKVRGFRIEPGEIEAALLAHPDVQAACAVAVRTPGIADSERALQAYVVPAHRDVRPPGLLDHLRARLPDHAVPAGIELIPSLPLTPNGKVDRARLPSPSHVTPADGPTDELATDTEQVVAEVWRSVLGRRSVAPTASFFELGGDSLAIVGVQARLRERIARDVPVVDLFRYPTVRALAAHLDGDRPAPGLDRAARRAAMRRARLGRRRDALTTPTGADPPLR